MDKEDIVKKINYRLLHNTCFGSFGSDQRSQNTQSDRALPIIKNFVLVNQDSVFPRIKIF